MNIQSIEKATDKTWEQWVRELDEIGARRISHTDLARKLNYELQDKLESSGWWAQAITVAYEQHIGRRVPGQQDNGQFEFAISKTVATSRDTLFLNAVKWFEKQKQFKGYEPLKPRSSETPKRSNWRCDFADGSKFSATIEDNRSKSKIILMHTAIPTKSAADDWKHFWRMIAAQLAEC